MEPISIVYGKEELVVTLFPNIASLAYDEKGFCYWHNLTEKRWIKYGDIFALDRALSRAILKYGTEELPELWDLLATCNLAKLALIGGNEEKFRTHLQEVESALKGIRRKPKLRARLQAHKLVKYVVRDSCGRHNPSAAMSRVTAAEQRLRERKADVEEILRSLEITRSKVQYWIRRQSRLNEQAIRSLRLAYARPQIVGFYLQRATLSVRDQLPIRPFINTRTHLLAELSESRKLLEAGEQENFYNKLKVMGMSLRLKLQLESLALLLSDLSLALDRQELNTPELRGCLIHSLGRINGEVLKVDDSGFQHKVVKGISAEIIAAILCLRLDEPLLLDAKRHLKKAFSML